MRTIERDIVGAFIFSNDGHILLGKSREGGVYKGLWVCPGGGIEAGETPLQAVIRETQEETTLDISNAPIVATEDSATGQSEKVLASGERVIVNMTFFDFLVAIDKPAADIPIAPTDDLGEVAWLELSNLNADSLSPGVQRRMQLLGHLAV